MTNTKFSEIQAATLIVVLVTSFLTSYTFSSVNLAIPSMSQEFGARATLVNWVVTAYVLVVSSLSIPFGRIADFFGRKRIMDIGLAVFSASTLAIAFASNIEFAIAMRALQGVGGAMVMSTNTAILVSAFPQNKRGAILGYNAGVVYTGQALGPALGGLLTYNFGWRSIFVSMAVVGFFALCISLIRLNRQKEQREAIQKGSFDVPGMALYIPGFFLVMFGLSEIGADPAVGLLVCPGIVLMILFVRHERAVQSPILDLGLFRNPRFVLSNVAAIFSFGSTFVVGYFLSIYLQVVKGYDAQSAGLVMITQPILVAVLSLTMGRLSDRYPPFVIASIGMALCAGSLLVFSCLTLSSPLWVVIFGLVVIGLGFGFFSPSNANAVMSAVPSDKMNAASAMLPTMRHVGNVSSMAIISFITNFMIGNASYGAAPKEKLMDAIHIAFVIFCAFCAVGVFISLQRRRNPDDKMTL